MKLDRFLSHIDKLEFSAAGENLGNELPRNRLDLLKQIQSGLVKKNDMIHFLGGEYRKGYLDAMQDIIASYQIQIEEMLRGYPICVSCKEKPATKWDGGVCGAVCKDDGMVPGVIMYLCDDCDPGNNYFTIPTDLEGAIGDLICLRETLQKMFARALKAEMTLLRKK